MAEAAGANVGVVFDTGNPFAVGEDPVAFARRAAHRIRHVHLKDYRRAVHRRGLSSRPMRDRRRRGAVRRAARRARRGTRR